LTVAHETFESAAEYWTKRSQALKWDCLFVLPPWLKAWWRVFHPDDRLHLCSVRDGEEIIGLAPLRNSGTTARFIGSVDVCDYQDFITAAGREEDFFRTLVADLRQQGIHELDLELVHPTSSVLTEFAAMARDLHCRFETQPVDVAMEINLPQTWEDYLLLLNAKQRHEVRRKLRRLLEAGRADFKCVDGVEDVRAGMDYFLRLFKSNRPDKFAFMTERMETFFRCLSEEMAGRGILKLFFLEVDDARTAAAMCFDYAGTRYLYNNGYDDRYSQLSVGILSKVLSIQESIRAGLKKYDLLKGAEVYKHRLGGEPVSLFRCRINLI
jgi:CelD/BcsL family acetyltransferase involved in cellulose biosynthesis